MQCREVQNLLPEYVQDNSSHVLESMLHEHLADCHACTLSLSRERELASSLQKLPVPTMRPGFLKDAIEQAEAANQPAVSPQKAYPWVAVAASAVLAVSLLFNGAQSPNEPAPEKIVQLGLGVTELVELRIDAPSDFENVQFLVQLPEHVALPDQPELREFAWNGQLKAGLNVLSLPLTGVLPENGELIAQVSFGHHRKSLKIPLSVNATSQLKGTHHV